MLFAFCYLCIKNYDIFVHLSDYPERFFYCTTGRRCISADNLPLMNGAFPLITERRSYHLQDKNQLVSMRNAFCCYYAVLGDVTEAAVRAGFSRGNALAEGIGCLSSAHCRKKIARLREMLTDTGNVAAGLKRLAFGNCSDAVYLVFADELPPPEVIEKLDLFNVSEIKRVKGGGVEVKLFDRLKALEKLFELENAFADRNRAADLISALTSQPEDGDAVED